MTPSNHSTLQVSLLDRIYTSLFARLTPRGEAMTTERRKELLRELRPDTLFHEMERWIELFDADWLKRLDCAMPVLSTADRRLAMLLHLGFSTTSIAFLTGRPTTASVHTAKARLKQRLASLPNL